MVSHLAAIDIRVLLLAVALIVVSYPAARQSIVSLIALVLSVIVLVLTIVVWAV